MYTQNNFIEISSCYFPGGTAGSDFLRKQSFSSGIRKLTSISNKYILGGDVNSRYNHWGSQRSNCLGNIIFNQLQLNQTRFPLENTYIPSDSSRQSSTLDFFLANAAQNLAVVKVINELIIN